LLDFWINGLVKPFLVAQTFLSAVSPTFSRLSAKNAARVRIMP